MHAAGHASQVNLWYSLRGARARTRAEAEVKFDLSAAANRSGGGKTISLSRLRQRRRRQRRRGRRRRRPNIFPLRGSGCPSPSSYLSVPSSSFLFVFPNFPTLFAYRRLRDISRAKQIGEGVSPSLSTVLDPVM